MYVLWGSTYLGIEVAIRTIPPFLMLATRFLIAGGLLYAWAIRRGDRDGDRPGLRQWLAACAVSAPLLLIGNGSVGWAEQHIDTGTAALIIASVPLWLALLDRTVYGQRLAPMAVVGLAVGFAGVGILVAPSGSFGAEVGASLVLVFASLAWAAGSLYSRKAPLPRRPLVGAAMQMLTGGAMLLVLGAASGELGRLDAAQVSWESGVGLAYLVVFGSLLGFTSYVWLLRAAPTSLVGTYAYVNPVVAVLLGTTLLDEPLSWRTLAGGGVIVAAVALIVRAPRRAPREVPEARPAVVAARGR